MRLAAHQAADLPGASSAVVDNLRHRREIYLPSGQLRPVAPVYFVEKNWKVLVKKSHFPDGPAGRYEARSHRLIDQGFSVISEPCHPIGSQPPTSRKEPGKPKQLRGNRQRFREAAHRAIHRPIRPDKSASRCGGIRVILHKIYQSAQGVIFQFGVGVQQENIFTRSFFDRLIVPSCIAKVGFVNDELDLGITVAKDGFVEVIRSVIYNYDLEIELRRVSIDRLQASVEERARFPVNYGNR